MKHLFRRALVPAHLAWSAALFPASVAAEQLDLRSDWRFHLGDATAAHSAEFDARHWRSVDLPHDWSIEGATKPDAPSSGAGGFFPTGIGWYRKTFPAPAWWRGRRVLLEFEAAAANAEVWINGRPLGRHPNPYTPFFHDVTPHLRIDALNTIAVRCDTSAQPASRWYVGSGLYRPVWLRVVDPVHIPRDTVAVRTTDLFPRSAIVELQADVRNTTDRAEGIVLDVTVADPDGLPIASIRLDGRATSSGDTRFGSKLAIPHPRPWTPDAPHLYRAIFRTFIGSRLTDRVETTFGLRTVSVSPDNGFLLNEQPLALIGGNVHHDHGPLGAAAFAAAEERKVRLLKDAGFNTVRTAHNPPSRAFLDACDRLGLLVINEAFDGWARAKTKHDYSLHFAEWWERDLDALLRRDRNHPSVVMWSIGNEMYERGAASGVQLAAAMRERIRNLDTSRPITAGVNGLGATGDWTRLDPLFASLDAAGYNYELHRHSEDHTRVPRRVIYAAESYQRDAFASWRATRDHPYVIGDFVWSAQDYLGEAGIGRVFPPDETAYPHWEGTHYPWHGAACGDLNLLGHRKPHSHYRNIVWDRGETLYAAVVAPTPDSRPWNPSAWAPPPLRAHWTWPGYEGREVQVEVYSRHPAVRLYLNDRPLGEKATTEAEEFKAVFTVPYAPGTLRVAGVRDGSDVETFTLTTAGPPIALRLSLEHSMGLPLSSTGVPPTPIPLLADGQDLAFIHVETVDSDGRVYPHTNDSVTYTLTGPARIAAIGNADLTSTESYQANPRSLSEGRALIVLRTTREAGEIVLTAAAPRLEPATLTLSSGTTVPR
jgi:beta-galactosidase